MGGSLLRRRAEDEPTTSSSSSMTSDSDRSSSRFVGCRGDSPGLSAVAERRGFVSVSEQFPRTAERPGVAMPQQSKPLAPPSWGGIITYNTSHKNNEGVRGLTPSGTPFGTGAGTPPDTLKCSSQNSCFIGFGRYLAIGSTRPSQGRASSCRWRVFGASHDETHLFPFPTFYDCRSRVLQMGSDEEFSAETAKPTVQRGRLLPLLRPHQGQTFSHHLSSRQANWDGDDHGVSLRLASCGSEAQWPRLRAGFRVAG